jgi:hypothetical protein
MAGTTRSFQDMLNEYLPNSLFEEELTKRDYFMNRVEKDNNWKGGKIIVPFKAAGASSIKFGGLTDSTDIARAKFVRGSIDEYQEVWGSMIFDHRDLLDHSGKVKEDSFLKILPNQVESFMEYMKMCASTMIMAGPHFALIAATTNAATGGTAAGILGVDHIDRFELDQKFTLDDGNSAQVDVYVTAIDVNESEIVVSATRGGGPLDVSAYTIAQSAKCYYDGVCVAGTATNKFQSVKDALLSAANGGGSTLHGKSKLAYPYLQAVNINGSTVSSTNILDKVFDGWTTVKKKAKGSAKEIVCALKHFGSIMKLIEAQKGGFKVSEGSRKASIYGWEEVEITSVTGDRLKIVGVTEMDEDVIFYLDWSGIVFRSNGFFRKRTAPDGKQYYETRTTTGYAYILDISLFGELEVNKPGAMGIMHSIPAYA